MVILYVILAVVSWILYVAALNLGLLFYYDWFSRRYQRYPSTTVSNIVAHGVHCVEQLTNNFPARRKLISAINVALCILNPITITATWIEAIIETFVEEDIRNRKE